MGYSSNVKYLFFFDDSLHPATLLGSTHDRVHNFSVCGLPGRSRLREVKLSNSEAARLIGTEEHPPKAFFAYIAKSLGQLREIGSIPKNMLPHSRLKSGYLDQIRGTRFYGLVVFGATTSTRNNQSAWQALVVFKHRIMPVDLKFDAALGAIFATFEDQQDIVLNA